MEPNIQEKIKQKGVVLITGNIEHWYEYLTPEDKAIEVSDESVKEKELIKKVYDEANKQDYRYNLPPNSELFVPLWLCEAQAILKEFNNINLYYYSGKYVTFRIWVKAEDYISYFEAKDYAETYENMERYIEC